MTQIAKQTINPGLVAYASTLPAKILPNNLGFVALTAGTDYLFEVGSSDGTQDSVQVLLDAVIAGTVTIEVSNAPKDPSSAPYAPPYEANLAHWQTWNPTTAVVAVSPGSVATNATVVVTAGAVGGMLFFLPNWGAIRTRLRFHCTTTGTCAVFPGAKY